MLPSLVYKTKKKSTGYLSTFSSCGTLIGTTSRKIVTIFRVPSEKTTRKTGTKRHRSAPSRRRILPSLGYETKKKSTRYISTFSSYGALIGTTSRKMESFFVYRPRNRRARRERSVSGRRRLGGVYYRLPATRRKKDRPDTARRSRVMGH